MVAGSLQCQLEGHRTSCSSERKVMEAWWNPGLQKYYHLPGSLIKKRKARKWKLGDCIFFFVTQFHNLETARWLHGPVALVFGYSFAGREGSTRSVWWLLWNVYTSDQHRAVGTAAHRHWLMIHGKWWAKSKSVWHCMTIGTSGLIIVGHTKHALYKVFAASCCRVRLHPSDLITSYVVFVFALSGMEIM